LAIAIHRMILLDEITSGPISWWHKRTWRFAGWSLAIGFGGCVLFLPYFVAEGTGAGGIFLVIGCVAAAVITVRLLLMFPQWLSRLQQPVPRHVWRQAGGIRAGISGAWRWRSSLPAVHCNTGPDRRSGCSIWCGIYSIGSYPASVLLWVAAMRNVVSALIQPFIVSLAAAVASWVYMWIQEHRWRPPCQQPPHEI